MTSSPRSRPSILSAVLFALCVSPAGAQQHQRSRELIASLEHYNHLAAQARAGGGALSTHLSPEEWSHAAAAVTELNDPRAIDVWSSLFGAIVSKLRCNVYYNYETYLFQNGTYWTVNRLPVINYTHCIHYIEQEYIRAPFKSEYVSKPTFA